MRLIRCSAKTCLLVGGVPMRRMRAIARRRRSLGACVGIRHRRRRCHHVFDCRFSARRSRWSMALWLVFSSRADGEWRYCHYARPCLMQEACRACGKGDMFAWRDLPQIQSARMAMRRFFAFMPQVFVDRPYVDLPGERFFRTGGIFA